MNVPAGDGTGSSSRGRRIAIAAALLAAVGATVLVMWGGDLGHRHTQEMGATLPIGQGITRVRLEVQNGRIGVDVPLDPAAAPAAVYQGGVRLAADTAEQLAELRRIPIELTAATDPARPDTLVLTGPGLPPGSAGVLAVELGLRLPSELALEIVVTGSGHVTIGNRTGPTQIDTGRGDLRFERVRGPVRAKTGRGMVIAFEHSGDLDLHTQVGDMQAFVRQPGKLLRLVSGHGTVQCGVPADCEFDLDARAEIGRIGADFDLAAEKVGEYGASLVGRRGSGATRVVLRTGSGHLAFRVKKFD